MKNFAFLLAASVALPLSAAAQAADPPDPPSATSASSRTDAPERDAGAISALQKMGSYLRTLTSFQVKGDIATEEVRVDGQKVQENSVATLVASRPNKLRIDIENERRPRQLLYDGKTFTMWAPRLDFYASMDAPPTIGELANQLDTLYNLNMPFVDFFRWGTDASDISEITSAVDLGPSQIGGVTCQQYAFRQDGLDWQIWIQNGDYPLPRKVVLTTTTDDARPQYVATYTWNLAPSFSDDAFVFRPDKDAKRISIAQWRQPQVAQVTP